MHEDEAHQSQVYSFGHARRLPQRMHGAAPCKPSLTTRPLTQVARRQEDLVKLNKVRMSVQRDLLMIQDLERNTRTGEGRRVTSRFIRLMLLHLDRGIRSPRAGCAWRICPSRLCKQKRGNIFAFSAANASNLGIPLPYLNMYFIATKRSSCSLSIASCTSPLGPLHRVLTPWNLGPWPREEASPIAFDEIILPALKPAVILQSASTGTTIVRAQTFPPKGSERPYLSMDNLQTLLQKLLVRSIGSMIRLTTVPYSHYCI